VNEIGQDLPETQRIAERSDARRDVRQNSSLLAGFCAVSVVTELITSSSLKSVVSISGASLDFQSRMSLIGEQRRAGVVYLAYVVALLGEARS
jgi:hypothetical protein